VRPSAAAFGNDCSKLSFDETIIWAIFSAISSIGLETSSFIVGTRVDASAMKLMRVSYLSLSFGIERFSMISPRTAAALPSNSANSFSIMYGSSPAGTSSSL